MNTNDDWKGDNQLAQDLGDFVSQNLKRAEILDFVQQKFPQYHWSIATLDRRLRYFGIHYINYNIPLADVCDAVKKELDGPGRLLGYRAMNHKLRTEHNVQVPRHLVHNVMAELDPEGLEARNLQKKKKKPKGNFTSEGPLWVVSLDGHDKLCGFQNSTFPLGVYGCIDTFSRKVLFLNVCYSNSNPLLIGRMYLKYLFDTEMLPVNIRMDRGTETGKLATIHVYLLNQHGLMDDPTDSIIFGPSTSNKIERWWRDLHERLEVFFKEQLTVLLRRRECDPLNSTDRQILAYVFIPIVNLVPRASFPLTSGRKTRALGATISGMRHRCRCAVSRITRIRLFPLFFHNGCSQSSRFPTAGQGERSSGNEIDQLSKESAISLSSTGIRTESVGKIKWSSQQVFQNTCFPSPSNTEERIWE